MNWKERQTVNNILKKKTVTWSNRHDKGFVKIYQVDDLGRESDFVPDIFNAWRSGFDREANARLPQQLFQRQYGVDVEANLVEDECWETLFEIGALLAGEKLEQLHFVLVNLEKNICLFTIDLGCLRNAKIE